MTRTLRNSLIAAAAALAVAAGSALAQTPAHDPSDRLREVLPAEVADRVLARIAAARQRGLPEQAIANRALKFASRGVAARDIERSVTDHIARMDRSRAALDAARGRRASGDEIEAGSEAIRQGVDGANVSELARSAPSGRSLAVPLYVIGSLVDRGLPSDEALRRVLERLQQRASDRDLERLPDQAVAARGRRPATAGRPEGVGRPSLPPQAGGAAAGRPAGAGPPAGVPANPGGRGGRPTTPGRP